MQRSYEPYDDYEKTLILPFELYWFFFNGIRFV